MLFVILQVNLADPSLANAPPPLPALQDLWDPQALGLVLLWVAFQALLYVLPVGKVCVPPSVVAGPAAASWVSSVVQRVHSTGWVSMTCTETKPANENCGWKHIHLGKPLKYGEKVFMLV